MGDAPEQPHWTATLASDARQGIVGNLAWLLAVGVGVVVFGLVGGTVPAWTLAAVVLVAAALVFLIVAGQVRTRARLEGELTAERKRVSELQTSDVTLRDQLRGATGGQPPISARAEDLLLRLRALREDAERKQEARSTTTDTHDAMMTALLGDVSKVVGRDDNVVRAASEEWYDTGHTKYLSNLVTTLGQLEAVVLSFGRRDAAIPQEPA